MRSKGLFASVLSVFFVLTLAGQAFGAIIRVKWDSPTNGTGGDWDHAYRTVAAGLTAAASGGEVWVARGTYVERITLKSGVALYGGFAGSETSRDERNFSTNVTILDGNQGGTVVVCPLNASLSTRIDGFTIRNGKASNGGGIVCTSSQPTIANCIITANIATVNGGGISGTATMCNNLVSANIAYTSGGGIYYSGAGRVLMLSNNTITGNTAQSGGGIYASTPATLYNNIVAFNSSGLYNSTGTPILGNNCFYNPDGYNYSGVAAGTGDIQADPLLVSVGFGDVHIQPGSPCVDAGDDTAVQAGWLDIDGQARIRSPHVDIGADECDGVSRIFTPNVIRVSTTGDDANGGSTWALAKRSVQGGINAAATNGGEVWVAAGTYAERITLPSRVFLYGGFAGAESTKSDRDPATNVTILDGLAAGSVITAQLLGQRTSGADGFTIRNGKASYGGGIYCLHASPVISNNIITANQGTSGGGGVYCSYASPVISCNSISANSGIAIYCVNYSSPAISRNTILSNQMGGIDCEHSDVMITDNVIGGNTGIAVTCVGGNSATVSGNTITGNTHYGVWCVSIPAATIADNVIQSNANVGVYCDGVSGSISGNKVVANSGHGIYCKGGSLTLTSNLVGGNQGAGVYCYNATATVSKNAIIGNADSGVYCALLAPKVLNNTITSNGGGVYLSSSSAVVANNIISGNTASTLSATLHMGGIYSYGAAPIICNNTITANLSQALYCNASGATISNNVMAFNSSGVYCSAGTPVLRNNCLYNPGGANYTGVSPGSGDVQLDPKMAAVEYGQVHIQPGSPCINAGCDTDVLVGWTDIDGQLRIQGEHVDIGADESDTTDWTYTPTVIRVKPDGDDGSDGSSWALAKRTVQAAAFEASTRGGEVWVAVGTYSERITLPSFAYLYGGFAGTETSRFQRDFVRNLSTLDGGAGGIVVQVMSASVRDAAGIDGFTIQNGKGAGVGGINCNFSSPAISNNRITGNVGCGIACNTRSVITGNTITGNVGSPPDIPWQTWSDGGGICVSGEGAVISGNIISSNTADYAGGIYCSGSVTISGNIIKSNTATTSSGGGVFLAEYYPSSAPVAVLSGNLITGNSAGSRGGGLFCLSRSIVTNNTIVGNSAPNGGGICAGLGLLSNNMLAFNSSGVSYYSYMVDKPTLRNNCVYNPAGYNYKNVSAGVGDISLDPLFANKAGGDYHLRSVSPCIEAGWSDATGIPATDMDGEARVNGVIDIGADEYWLGPARTVSDAKAASDTSQVDLYGGVVSAVFGDSFYVESDDRTSGMLVKKSGHSLQAGNRARVLGYPATNLDSERFIDASTADSTGIGSVAALGMPNRSVGGGPRDLQGGVWGWVYTVDSFGKPIRIWDRVQGLNNIGLLISTCGRVTGIEPTVDPAPTWFTTDDGGALDLKCTIPSGVTIDPTWQYVRVTGVSSCEKVGGELHAVVKVRSQGDIVGF